MQKYRRIKRKKKSIGKNIFIIFIIIISLVLIASLVRLYMITDVEKINEDLKVERTSQTTQAVESKDKTIEDIIEEVNHSVVGISKIKDMGSSIFTEDGIEKLGLGTGIIASSNGYIITNKHVSGDKYSSCYVTLENGNTYDATVVWADATLDLSIVKINLEGLTTIKLGDSNSVKAGQSVYAIGNPIGYEFERTVTSGIISAKSRTLKFTENGEEVLMTDLIQTDATINEGNSGGPLVNTKGELIGVNTVKITEAEGIGFAVPINIVKPILEKLMNTGKFEEAYLGIYGYDKEVIPYLENNLEIKSGVYVASISADGPLFNKEIRVGDIITKIDDTEINKMNDLRKYIYSKNPKDKVKLTVKRNNTEKILEIQLGQKM